MTESAPKRIELEADDRRRVQRLTEEVQGRLEEIGLIAARAHGIRLDEGAVRKFVPHRSQAPGRARHRRWWRSRAAPDRLARPQATSRRRTARTGTTNSAALTTTSQAACTSTIGPGPSAISREISTEW